MKRVIGFRRIKLPWASQSPHRGFGYAILLVALSTVAAAQMPGAAPPPPPAPPPGLNQVMGGGAGAMGQQAAGGSMQGSVPQGNASAQPIVLGLDDAVQRGLRYNLASLLASSQTEQARAQKYEALSALLPQIDLSAEQTREKINLAAYGISLPGIPSIVGPFNVFAAQGTGSEALSWAALENTRAAHNDETAAHADLAATRNLVVVAVVNQYLLAVSDQSRVAAVQAELDTAQQELQQAQDMLQAGTADALQSVRAEVERDQERQRLLSAQNDLDKQRLQLGRVIGLPSGQAFTLSDTLPFTAMPAMDPATAVAQALAARPDYRAAQAAQRGAQYRLAAARAQRLPSLDFTGSWGTLGQEIDSNHGVFSIAASVQMPVFQGGAIHAEVLAAEAQVRDSEDRAADLRAQIDTQVRDALLDINASSAQVTVATSARDLAQRELGLSRDRFSAGVADNLEVVQAQQSLAAADESYIQSLYSYNLAKAVLAQALGTAETSYRQYLLTP